MHRPYRLLPRVARSPHPAPVPEAGRRRYLLTIGHRGPHQGLKGDRHLPSGCAPLIGGLAIGAGMVSAGSGSADAGFRGLGVGLACAQWYRPRAVQRRSARVVSAFTTRGERPRAICWQLRALVASGIGIARRCDVMDPQHAPTIQSVEPTARINALRDERRNGSSGCESTDGFCLSAERASTQPRIVKAQLLPPSEVRARADPGRLVSEE